jgi:hypothetical protein
MFLASFLGTMLGYLAGTGSLLLYSHLRDLRGKKERDEYKQKVLDALSDWGTAEELDTERIVVRKGGVPRVGN